MFGSQMWVSGSWYPQTLSKHFWDFRDALRQKSLCFFPAFLQICKQKKTKKKRYNFETAKGRNLKSTS